MKKYYKCLGYTGKRGCSESFLVGKIYKFENGTILSDPTKNKVCWTNSIENIETEIILKDYKIVRERDPINFLREWYILKEVFPFNCLLD